MTEVIGFFVLRGFENVHFKESCEVASAISQCPAHDAAVPGITRGEKRYLRKPPLHSEGSGQLLQAGRVIHGSGFHGIHHG